MLACSFDAVRAPALQKRKMAAMSPSVSPKVRKRDLPPRLNLRHRKRGWPSSKIALQSEGKNYKIKSGDIAYDSDLS